ncbi:DNA polymerase III sliding clamp beta [Gordonia phage Niagara]|nr:DNA polymerase III sliding clamp beta [Gordonia phage Niagara]
MTTTIEFENSAFADAIKKASAVAPTKSDRFMDFHGFVFEFDGEYVTLRCTDGDIFYMETLYPVKSDGPPVTWRVSSKFMFNLTARLPSRMGSKLVLSDEQSTQLAMTSGSMKATLPIVSHEAFPEWNDFDDTDLPVVENFGKLVDAVAWSCSKKNDPPLTGVYIDEEKLVASNNYTLATMPIKIDLSESDHENIVVPVRLLGPVLRNFDEVKVGVEDSYLLIAPSEDVHIKCVLYDDAYKNVDSVFAREFPDILVFENKQYIVEIVERVCSAGTDDRQVAMELEIGDEMAIFAVRSSDTGEGVEESIFMVDQCEHPPVKFKFSSEYFKSAVQNAPGKSVIMHYNKDKPSTFVKFQSEDGYEAIAMPRRTT